MVDLEGLGRLTQPPVLFNSGTRAFSENCHIALIQDCVADVQPSVYDLNHSLTGGSHGQVQHRSVHSNIDKPTEAHAQPPLLQGAAVRRREADADSRESRTRQALAAILTLHAAEETRHSGCPQIRDWTVIDASVPSSQLSILGAPKARVMDAATPYVLIDATGVV